jgi:hypothetical protein
MKKISEWGPADHLAEIIIVIAGLFFVYKISGWATSLVTFVFWLAVGAALDLSGVGSGLFVLIGAHVFVLIIAGALGILWRDKKDLSGQEFQTTMGALLQNRRHQRASTPIKRLRSRKNGAYSVRRGSKALRVASGDRAGCGNLHRPISGVSA